jgi:hypothetical protein
MSEDNKSTPPKTDSITKVYLGSKGKFGGLVKVLMDSQPQPIDEKFYLYEWIT